MRIQCSLLLLMLTASCNGQVARDLPEESGSKPAVAPPGHPTMRKAQGKYSYFTHTGPWTDTNVCISNIIVDRSGNIWAATMGEGVYRYDGTSFTNFTTKDGLITNVVYSILEDGEGNIWFGTTNGVSRYDHKKNPLLDFHFRLSRARPVLYLEQLRWHLPRNRRAPSRKYGV